MLIQREKEEVKKYFLLTCNIIYFTSGWTATKAGNKTIKIPYDEE